MQPLRTYRVSRHIAQAHTQRTDAIEITPRVVKAIRRLQKIHTHAIAEDVANPLRNGGRLTPPPSLALPTTIWRLCRRPFLVCYEPHLAPSYLNDEIRRDRLLLILLCRLVLGRALELKAVLEHITVPRFVLANHLEKPAHLRSFGLDLR